MAELVRFRKDGGECFARITRAVIGTEVDIYGYKKVIPAETCDINLTPYLDEECDYALPDIPDGETMNGWTGANIPGITVNGTQHIAQFTYMPYAIDGTITMRILSDIKKQRIGFGQWAQIYVGIPASESANKYFYEGGFNHGTYISNTDSVEIGIMAGRVKTNEIGFYASPSEAFPGGIGGQEYDVKPIGANSRRLAWINRYGCIDFWTFDFVREQTIAVSSESIYTSDGYEKLNINADKHTLIETRELDRATLDALSYITRSPHVWLLDDDGTGAMDEAPDMEEIHVLTDSVRIYSDTELSTLQIEFCPKVFI